MLKKLFLSLFVHQIMNWSEQIMPNFLNVSDIMRILGVKKTTAYSIIQQLNNELTAKGYYVKRGRVDSNYFSKRYCYKED